MNWIEFEVCQTAKVYDGLFLCVINSLSHVWVCINMSGYNACVCRSYLDLHIHVWIRISMFWFVPAP